MTHTVTMRAARVEEAALLSELALLSKAHCVAARGRPIGTRESGSISGRFLPLFEIALRDPPKV